MLAVAANPSPRLPRAVSLLLLAGTGVMAAQITWQVLAPDLRPAATVEIPVTEPAPPAPDTQESPLAGVAEVPLFGVPGVRGVPEPVAAPDTRLRLRLVGLVAGDTPDQGRAIIAESGSPERLYAVGDALGGGQARLHQIHADRVILERGGSYETLRLPRADGSAPGRTAASPDQHGIDPRRSEVVPVPPPQRTDIPSIQRSEWLDDPDRLLQVVRARPVIRDGNLHGLEVRPTRNARQFEQAGLRPGDVITSVNGVPLSAIDDPDRLFEDLAAQTQVSIVVERDGQPLPLTIQLLD